MIKKLTLKFGKNGKGEKLEIEPGSVTIFVGPNNSGKSLALREVEAYCQNGSSTNLKIVDSIDFLIPDDAELRRQVDAMQVPFSQEERPQAGQVKFGRFNSTRGFLASIRKPEDILSWKNTPGSLGTFIQHYLSMYVSRFGGKERFELARVS
jgi:ABC-type hemin transport system ATPase subunit